MDTFTQPKIIGYRQLTENDAKLMNEIKAQGLVLDQMIQMLEHTPGLDKRWLAIGKTDLQTGLMALTRAVAQPTSF